MTNKDLLAGGNFFAIRPEIVAKCGLNAAYLFAHLVNQNGMHANIDGWFWLTQEKLTDLTGFTRHVTSTALAELQKNELVMVDIRGEHFRKHFKLVANCEAMFDALKLKAGENQPAKILQGNLQNIYKVPCENFEGYPANNLQVTLRKIEEVPCENFNTYTDNNNTETNKHTQEDIHKETIARKRAGRVKKKKEENPLLEKLAIECIEHLNRTTGKKFQNGQHNVELYKRLLVDGYAQQDIFEVHELKWMQWKDREDMHQFLCPSTLVGPKNFKRYRQHVEDAKANINTYRPAAQMTLDEKNHFQFQSTVAEMLARRAREGRL
jgi:uncharacterized phage protein (TIGR02220 family)